MSKTTLVRLSRTRLSFNGRIYKIVPIQYTAASLLPLLGLQESFYTTLTPEQIHDVEEDAFEGTKNIIYKRFDENQVATFHQLGFDADMSQHMEQCWSTQREYGPSIHEEKINVIWDCCFRFIPFKETRCEETDTVVKLSDLMPNNEWIPVDSTRL
jgi:hypothetical protein